MENMQEINRKIADNLTKYRKAAGLTQAELAEKINYSDKSVSKWESGNGIPDIYTLVQLANLFGVTVNAFLGDDEPVTETPAQRRRKTFGFRLFIMLLSSGIVWLVATCIFVAMQLWFPSGKGWLAFMYAVVANAIVMIVYSGIWKYRVLNFISVSTLIWTTLTCLCLTIQAIVEHFNGNVQGLWGLFLIGVPLQVLEILWVFFRSLFKKSKEKRKTDSVLGMDASEKNLTEGND